MNRHYRLWSHERTLMKVAGLLGGLAKGRLLDIAAGEGCLSERAASMGFETRACDLNTAAFKTPGVTCVRCNLDEGVPFRDGSFDCAVCIEALEHLRDRYAFFAECARVLRPGGVLIVTTPNVLNLAARAKYLLSGFLPLFSRPPVDCDPDPTHLHINPVAYHYLRHALVMNRFGIEKVTTDRHRKAALALAWLYPVMLLASRHSVRKERRPGQRGVNRGILRTMHTAALLFGRTLIVLARKPRETRVSTQGQE